MKNTLTAKEWLEKEGFKEIESTSIEQSIAREVYYKTLEDYANYKNKVLEDRIKEFSNLINNIDYPDDVITDIKSQYDKHFNIK
jgi:hypothetical protein